METVKFNLEEKRKEYRRFLAKAYDMKEEEAEVVENVLDTFMSKHGELITTFFNSQIVPKTVRIGTFKALTDIMAMHADKLEHEMECRECGGHNGTDEN